MGTEHSIKIENVVKQFDNPSTLALNNITATIEPGSITGLVGPDGAGKTTLIRLMTGLMLPTEGNITVCGINTRTRQPELFDKLGYMPQKFGLYEDLTVMENLNLYAELRQLTASEKLATFEKMLHFTNLSQFQKRRAGKLSGGMKQKLGLACALLSEPNVLLLDEPSVGVDPISRRELWELVTTVAKDGIGVVWATSYLDEAEKCEKVILLNEGTLLYYGNPQDLTRKVTDNVFLTKVKNTDKRVILSELLQTQGVIDGVIQGDCIRFMMSHNSKTPENLIVSSTAPRFEDGFIDILKGKYLRHSELATHIHIKTNDADPIVATELTKYFGPFCATNKISFTIKRGEIFGLLGPNGAGKSTTFKMLCGLLQPNSGKALVSGYDLKTSSSQARSKLGYMAQKFSLYGSLSVKQNLDFFSGVYGLKNRDRNNKIKQMYNVFNLSRYSNVNADQLPLGYKQRLALACATIHEPDVLFLDEPTSGVDPLTRREFWVHINSMVQKGITIMVTTHFMDEAEYCDRIALIYQGENIAMDTPDNLKNSIRLENQIQPTLEETFIELINRHEINNRVSS
jgi:ABC-2 type transport system ATP-binding protein